MYQLVSRCEVLYGHAADVIECYEEINRLCAKRGMQQARLLARSFGPANVIVTETDYDTFAALEADRDRFQSDPEIMKAFRTSAQWVVQGSAHTELLREAPHLA